MIVAVICLFVFILAGALVASSVETGSLFERRLGYGLLGVVILVAVLQIPRLINKLAAHVHGR